mgnify:FL=1
MPTYQAYFSKTDHKRILPPSWGHGPFPAKLEQNLALLDPNHMITMGSGTPNKDFFSVKNITVNHSIDLHYQKDAKDSHINSFYIGEKVKQSDVQKADSKIEELFEYADNTFGSYSTIDLVKKLTKKFEIFKDYKSNNFSEEDYDYCVTSGTSASSYYLCQLLLDDTKTILVEELTFTVILGNVSMTGANVVPFNVNLNANDENGENPIDTKYLENLLKNWSTIHPKKPFPSVFYTIPVQNPTGLVQKIQHKREIYDILKKYKILVMEDDPYGYLTLTDDLKSNCDFNDKASFESQKQIYFSALKKTGSYLSIDTEGLVIRCESFSKIFGTGLRLGFIIGPKKIIDRVKNYIECSTREISGLSMTVFNQCCQGMDKLLCQNLKTNDIEQLDGWVQWCINLCVLHRHKQKVLYKELTENPVYASKRLFTCIKPTFGMFLFIGLNLNEFKSEALKSPQALTEAMQYMDYKLLENNLDAIIGTRLIVDINHSFKKSGFIRVTTSQIKNDKELAEAARRICTSIEQFFDEYLTKKQPYPVLL